MTARPNFRSCTYPDTHDGSALFNKRTGELFSGDVIYDDEGAGLLDTTSDSSLALYVASFQKLKQMDVQTTYPGHGADTRPTNPALHDYSVSAEARLTKAASRHLKLPHWNSRGAAV